MGDEDVTEIGRYLVDIEAKEFEQNVNVRDTNDIIEMAMPDDDEAEIFDGEFVLLKFRRGLKMFCRANDMPDVPEATILINKTGRRNLGCGSNDLVSLLHVPVAPVLSKVVLQAIDETVEFFEGDIKTTFLDPYFQAESQAKFDNQRPVTKGNLISVKEGNITAWFKVKEVHIRQDGARRIKNQGYGVVVYEGPGNELNTEVVLDKRPISMEEGEGSLNKVGYADIGGLGEQLGQIRELIELPIRHPKLFTSIGVRPPKGVLMHGPPGTGKTLIAKAVANESDCWFKAINGPEIVSGGAGESEKKLRSIFEEARRNAPSIIFIDEIDSLAPNRDKTKDEGSRRLVATFLTEMDGMNEGEHVMVIAATNRPNTLDPALRRAGRFDQELVIGVPSQNARREILGILTRKQKLDNSQFLEDDPEVPNPEYVDLDWIASKTHGFVGADLANLCSKAAISAITEAAQDLDLEADYLPNEFYLSLKMGMSDFKRALPDVPPSALKEFVVEKPSTTFADIGGLDDVKRELMEMIEFGKDDDGYFDSMGLRAPSGCMFYGPPGCGKTLLAKAMANEMESNFISIKGPELSSKWFGEAEGNLRSVFERARQASPCILFFDEMDSLARSRGSGTDAGVGDRMVNQLLTEMDGIGQRANVFVIGATNMITHVSQAVMRPGRLDQLIYIPLPDLAARRSIIRAVLRKTKCADNIDFDRLAADTEGYSGADLAGVCQTAVKLAVRVRVDEIKEGLLKLNPKDKEGRAKFKAQVDQTPLVVDHRVIEVAKQQSKPSLSSADHQKYLHQRDMVMQQGTGGASGKHGTVDDEAAPDTGMFRKQDAVVEEMDPYADSDED